MKNTHTVEGFIESVDHVGTSGNGNPTYRVTLRGGDNYRTQTDGGVGYGITNYAPNSRRPERKVRLTLTKNHRIIGCEYAD